MSGIRNNGALWPVVFRADQQTASAIHAEHRIIKGVEYSEAQLRDEAAWSPACCGNLVAL